MLPNVVGIVGLGQMGLGIAQVFAQAGFLTKAIDTKKEALEKAKVKIEESLNKLCKKGVLLDPKEVFLRINFLDRLEGLKECNLVIEAIIENEQAKKDLFLKLDNLLSPDTIFASNTSSIPITALASSTKRADRFIGMHFMNPVPLMPLVEIIMGHKTSDETLKKVRALVEKLGKKETLSQDYPGFIANRILMPMINEAFYALMEQVGTAEAIDATMKFGCNFPMGPLTLADFIGLDICLAILEVLHKGLGQDKYAPCPLLKKYVNAGQLGRKTGIGVFSYGL